jgi:hypothetical protein
MRNDRCRITIPVPTLDFPVGTPAWIGALFRAIVNNSAPKPFSWSKTADDILASIERFCVRISKSAH